MDKQTIIGQLELDINALQRQVQEFKIHPENITSLEWELFVKRLQLMHDYCRQLKMQAQATVEPQVQLQPEIRPVERKEEITVPVVESIVPESKEPEVAEEEREVEKNEEVVMTTPQEEIKEEPVVIDQQVNIIAHLSATVEQKVATPKAKKQIASVGGLFGDTHSLADQFKEEPTIANKIAKSKSEKSVADKLQHKPVKDLKDAIGINEKFLFINELFDGNLQDYSEALNKINTAENLQSAEEFIRAELAIRFNWSDENDHVRNFRDLVERRFIS